MVVAGIMRIVLHAACPVICNGEQHRDCRRQLHQIKNDGGKQGFSTWAMRGP